MSTTSALRASTLTLLIAACLGGLALPVHAAEAAAAATQNTAAARFKALYTREWRWRQAQA
ncbi:hypothetical protein L2216_13085, partial [Xanthomonas perforans]|nr:hypothetical protein [Xanthomonas perforans]